MGLDGGRVRKRVGLTWWKRRRCAVVTGGRLRCCLFGLPFAGLLPVSAAVARSALGICAVESVLWRVAESTAVAGLAAQREG